MFGLVKKKKIYSLENKRKKFTNGLLLEDVSKFLFQPMQSFQNKSDRLALLTHLHLPSFEAFTPQFFPSPVEVPV
jgi:hypothetical protein